MLINNKIFYVFLLQITIIVVDLQKIYIVMTKKYKPPLTKKNKIKPTAITTTKWLKKYLTQPLKDNKVEALFGAYAMENTFGEKIHKQINQFCLFCEQRNIHKGNISINLAHDLGGGLRNDTKMRPRVSRYLEEGVRVVNHNQTGKI